MEPSDAGAPVDTALSIASALGLEANDAAVLQDSNRLAVHLQPCDILARVAPGPHRAGAAFEVEVARWLARTDAPVAALDPRVEPRVHERDGLAVTFWAYHEPVPPREIAPAEYAEALARLHAGMREVKLPTPHFTDRVAEAQRIVDSPEMSPELGAADREFLGAMLRELRQAICEREAPEQLLHGEPHPGNLLRTRRGLLFIDLETCCRGPVEFDVAGAPEAVGEHYPGLDRGLLEDCRTLALGLVAAWRWDRDDHFPDGRLMGIELLDQIRAARSGPQRD